MLRILGSLLLLAAVASQLPAASRVVPGHPPPDFSVTTLDGRKLDIRDLHGKRVLVFMWASW
jgi:hypothetical protein